jgi:predicted transcriptional regulator
MATITLKPDLAEQISSLADNNQTSAEAFVDKALRTYLAQFRRDKIRKEAEAFNRQRKKLFAKYPGQYVAIHNGQVIDNDQNLRTLHLRVYARLGHIPVLLKQVTREPDRELLFRSPRFERDSANATTILPTKFALTVCPI